MNSDRGLAASRNFIAGSLAITTGLVVTGSLTSLTIASSLAIRGVERSADFSFPVIFPAWGTHLDAKRVRFFRSISPV